LTTNQVLNTSQAAELLQMTEQTLLRLTRKGVIPGAQIGRRWVFIEDDLVAAIRDEYTRPRLVSREKETNYVALQARRYVVG
jgi:excisionase family DNA binding protein